jgi:hypothetical protein
MSIADHRPSRCLLNKNHSGAGSSPEHRRFDVPEFCHGFICFGGRASPLAFDTRNRKPPKTASSIRRIAAKIRSLAIFKLLLHLHHRSSRLSEQLDGRAIACLQILGFGTGPPCNVGSATIARFHWLPGYGWHLRQVVVINRVSLFRIFINELCQSLDKPVFDSTSDQLHLPNIVIEGKNHGRAFSRQVQVDASACHFVSGLGFNLSLNLPGSFFSTRTSLG